MADGDLILRLRFVPDPGYISVPDPEPPPMGSCGAELYDVLRWTLAPDDHLHGWALAHLCEAIGRMRQQVSDLVSEDGEHPGWSSIMHVDRCPTFALPWHGVLAGVRGIEGLSDAERRRAIRERASFHRGRPSALIAFAQRFTDGADGSVTLRERYDPREGAAVDAPDHIQVRIRRSRLAPEWVGQEATVRARVLAEIPAGLIGHVEITDEADYDDVLAGYTDYDDVAARVADYDELLGGA